jgi:hydroxymethylbilane synthase
MKTVRVGSRDSLLAIAQAKMVMAAIQRFDPGIHTELITMKTTGDVIVHKPLYEIGGKGLFVKELDEALLSGEVDITVHSYKDMPMENNRELPVVAVSPRADPRDALLLSPRSREDGEIKNIGCSSPRRTAQLKDLFPQAAIAPLRGNVPTRIGKLDQDLYSAIVLANAGLTRLGLAHRADRLFSIEEMIPSACQGIIAVQARAGTDTDYLKFFHDSDAQTAAIAERGFVIALGGGCTSPVAAYAQVRDDSIQLHGFFLNEATGDVQRGTLSGRRADAPFLGECLADKLTTRKEAEQ